MDQPLVDAEVDLNGDVGEGLGDDAALIPWLSSSNIACGRHAGDPATMAATVGLATRARVAVGAHPGFDDRAHFGRRELRLLPGEVEALVTDQIQELIHVARPLGATVTHVKPHGALYNMAAREAQLADAIAAAMASVDRSLILFGLSGSELVRAGERAGLRTASEAFADRAYQPDGTLVPRGVEGAVLHGVEHIVARAVAMVREQAVVAVDGSRVPLRVDTLCVHGDTPGAADMARSLSEALVSAGITVRSLLARRSAGREGGR